MRTHWTLYDKILIRKKGAGKGVVLHTWSGPVPTEVASIRFMLSVSNGLWNTIAPISTDFYTGGNSLVWVINSIDGVYI